jgi:hypothetical protein
MKKTVPILCYLCTNHLFFTLLLFLYHFFELGDTTKILNSFEKTGVVETFVLVYGVTALCGIPFLYLLYHISAYFVNFEHKFIRMGLNAIFCSLDLIIWFLIATFNTISPKITIYQVFISLLSSQPDLSNNSISVNSEKLMLNSFP